MRSAPATEGPLYLEVVPRSFAIKVQTGQSLNQIASFAGEADRLGCDLQRLHAAGAAAVSQPHRIAKPLRSKEFRTDEGSSLDRSERRSERGDQVIGYRAKKNSHVIDLRRSGITPRQIFGSPCTGTARTACCSSRKNFISSPSKERIRVPPGYAAEMVAYEAACGELRTHYAGFFDPGFGYGADGELKGTQVVLEVRPHDVPFLIHDGQTFFKVVYDRMLDVPDRLYGVGLGSSYQQQALTLSKHFKA